MMKLKCAVVSLSLILLSSCSGLHKIHEKVNQKKRQTVYEGDFHGITYLVVESKLKRKLEYKLIFDCHTPWGQSLSKVVDNEEWRAVTDTIPDVVFLGKKLNVDVLYKPIVFMPITNEEIELLGIGTEKSSGCNAYTAEPLSKIKGYVKTTLVYKK